MGQAGALLGTNPGACSDFTEVSLLLNQASTAYTDRGRIKKQNERGA